jgi:hypothetical protein
MAQFYNFLLPHWKQKLKSTIIRSPPVSIYNLYLFKPVAFGDRFQNGVEPKKFGVSAVADPDDARGG